jgi:hypothetical protein
MQRILVIRSDEVQRGVELLVSRVLGWHGQSWKHHRLEACCIGRSVPRNLELEF